MRIICDTNVWYGIGNGTLDPSKLSGLNLVATFYNFQELITSPNNLTDFQMVRRAAKAIIDHSSEQVLENAYLYLANMIDSRYEDTRYAYNIGLRNRGYIRHLASLSSSYQLTATEIKDYQNIVAQKTTGGAGVALIDNDFATRVKAYSKRQWKASQQKYYDERFKGLLFELNDYLKLFSNNRLEVMGVDVKQIELFLAASLQFVRNLELAKWVAQPNDTYDLYNLIYVTPRDKYLTLEKRWQRLIVEAGLQDYLLIL